MKRADWPTSQKPEEMLSSPPKAKRSGRKLRLFACACCRRVWPLLSAERSRRGVEVAEACADGLATDSETEEALDDALGVYAGSTGMPESFREAAKAVSTTLFDFEKPAKVLRHASLASYNAIRAACLADAELHPADSIADDAPSAVETRESSIQADWLRCVFGYLFRPQTIQPAWCTATVVALAQTAYDARSLPSGELEWTRLAILADALEEVGCTDSEMLSHCREPGTHIRGCWVVDLILGRK